MADAMIGRITINTPDKMTTRATMHGVIRIKMPGKQTLE
jgi:hypothetical protein